MRKVVAIAVAILLTIGLSVTALAAEAEKGDFRKAARNRNPESTPTIYNITSQVFGASAYGDYMGDAATDPDATKPGDQVRIPLLKGGFRGEDGGEIERWSDDPEEFYLGPTVRQLKDNRVTAEIGVAKGKDFIKSIEIAPMTPTDRNPARSMVVVTFVDDFHSSAEFQYEFSVYLSLDRRVTATSEVFGGTLSNEIYDVYQIDYLYIGDGQIAYAETGTQMGLRLDLGNGVMLHRDMFKGERYYGYATLYGNEFQDPIATAYRKSIDTVIDITSIDMKVNGGYVTFEKELSNPSFYVYNLAGEYVGRSGDTLPYSTRYYLAIEEIDIDPALSQHPVPTADEATMGEALQRFLEGGRAAALAAE